MANNLRIMEWNANGLLKHKDELQTILNIENIDVCLISETHFTTQLKKFRPDQARILSQPDHA